ncbi:class I SAM-dependent methyltransferase [Maricurvus nonylphenolicus]|uniref:class I SAM-dependent methyltransferase n=1 Tax=Maricurvus nonylphenolicus TaxID=1008307 RepID=UPI0036F32873
MEDCIINGYAEDSELLIQSFESINSVELLSHVSDYIPNKGALIDVGAGTGRDAACIASSELKVLAVEPVLEFRTAARQLHLSPNIEWIDDSLPHLSKVCSLNDTFDAALLVSVWQHVKSEDKASCLRTLRSILNVGGKLIISVRSGPGSPKRKCYPTTPQETSELAGHCGFDLLASHEASSLQKTNQKAGVKWTWLVFMAV